MNVTAGRHAMARVEVRAVPERDFSMRSECANEMNVGTGGSAGTVFSHRKVANGDEGARERELGFESVRMDSSLGRRRWSKYTPLSSELLLFVPAHPGAGCGRSSLVTAPSAARSAKAVPRPSLSRPAGRMPCCIRRAISLVWLACICGRQERTSSESASEQPEPSRPGVWIPARARAPTT